MNFKKIWLTSTVDVSHICIVRVMVLGVGANAMLTTIQLEMFNELEFSSLLTTVPYSS